MNKIILEDIKEIYSRIDDWKCLQGKTILITGPYGMIASYFVFLLIYLNEIHNMNIKIIALGRSASKFEKRFGKYSHMPYMTFLSTTLNEKLSINENVDYIVHAASFASPQYYDVCPVDVLEPNIIGTYNLLEFAKCTNVKNFLLFSTGDIYGKIEGKEFIYEDDIGSVNTLDIHSCYSESKRMAETICYSFFYQYNTPVKIARIWHTYSPTMDIKKDPRVFASFMNNIVSGNDIELKSDGNGKRTFCYIVDAIAGLFTIMLKGVNGEAYNVCNTKEFVSIKNLAEQLTGLRKDVSLKVVIKERDANEHYTENTAIGNCIPSDAKLRRLGWEPKYCIRDGFQRVLYYFMNER